MLKRMLVDIPVLVKTLGMMFADDRTSSTLCRGDDEAGAQHVRYHKARKSAGAPTHLCSHAGTSHGEPAVLASR